MKKTKIIVADAQELVAEGLRARLSDIPEFEIVGHASTGTALLKALATHEVDLVLMEVSLPGMDGIDATRKLHEQFPNVKVLAHSVLTAIEYVNSMLIEGASGYVVKSASKEELTEALRAVMRGEKYISEEARKSVEEGYRFTEKRMDGEYVGLTAREREIIRLIALEKTNEEISAILFVSVDTIKTHRKNLMNKLNVRSTAGLVKYAVDRCWI